MEPQYFARQPALTRPRQKIASPRTVGAIGVTQRVRQHNGAFPFPVVAVDFLAISPCIAD
jgi:hypothetical protein